MNLSVRLQQKKPVDTHIVIQAVLCEGFYSAGYDVRFSLVRLTHFQSWNLQGSHFLPFCFVLEYRWLTMLS